MPSSISSKLAPFYDIYKNVSEAVEVATPDFNKGILKGRDVVVINLIGQGNGDKYLGEKIANIALDEGCRVSIISLNIYSPDITNSRNISLCDDEPYDLAALHNPVFIITPMALMSTKSLCQQIEKICERYQFSKQNAILIDEMDVTQSEGRLPHHYENALKGIGFENVSANRLGFSTYSIGYLPVDDETVKAIRGRFEGELLRLFDSYNLSLTSDSHYNFAYISTDFFITSTQVFLANTLTETMGDDKDASYVMVLRQYRPDLKKAIYEGVLGILSEKSEELNYSRLFSKAVVGFVNNNTGEIEPYGVISGSGEKKINILFTQQLPKNLFDDFMCLCETGMVSGDQSLSEYLSLKGTLPYYSVQSWSHPLARAMVDHGAKSIRDIVEHKMVFRGPVAGFESYKLKPNIKPQKPSARQLKQLDALNKKIASTTATQYIRTLLRSQPPGKD